MEDKDLKQLAIDIYDGKIYTSLHGNPNDLNMVFMLLNFGAIEPEKAKNIGLIYEYMDKANPMSVNGLPTFLSMKVLNKEDTEKMLDYYKKYEKLHENFIKEE